MKTTAYFIVKTELDVHDEATCTNAELKRSTAHELEHALKNNFSGDDLSGGLGSDLHVTIHSVQEVQ